MTKLAEKKRPTGVTVIAILNIIIGVLNLIAVWFFNSMIARPYKEVTVAIYGICLVPIGILLFFLAHGFWVEKIRARNGEGLAWLFCMGTMVWVFLFSGQALTTGPINTDLIYFSLMGLFEFIYSLLILYYLNRPNVKAFFSKT